MAHHHDQSVNEHRREIRQLTESMEDAQARIAGLDTHSQEMIQHEHHVNQTIDWNTHSQVASIGAIIDEQKDLRKLVEELASRMDQSQGNLSTPRGEASTNILLDWVI